MASTRMVMVALRELVGGLVEQQQRDPNLSLQEGFTIGPNARNRYWKPGMKKGEACECVASPTHCFRSASQRSMDTPVTFLGSAEVIPPTVDAWPIVVSDPLTGLLQGQGTAGTGAGIVFHDADNNNQRERIANLVLMAFRASVQVYTQWAAVDGAVPMNPIDLGEWSCSFERAILDFVGLEIYSTSDRSEPWVSWTPLTYFCRPDNLFVPVPWVLWRDRDPACRLIDRVAEQNNGPVGVAQYPEIILDNCAYDVQAQITIESLWAPNPEVCGPYWPGELCPPHLVANTPAFMQSHHQM